jgi:hypothetical protein
MKAQRGRGTSIRFKSRENIFGRRKSKSEYIIKIELLEIECPTRYRTRHFFNNFTTKENIATKFEEDLPHCVRNVKEKNVLQISLQYLHWC